MNKNIAAKLAALREQTEDPEIRKRRIVSQCGELMRAAAGMETLIQARLLDLVGDICRKACGQNFPEETEE
jgi:hypothetical protein